MQATETTQVTISTLELIKAGWPLVLGMIAVTLWLGRTQFMTAANKEEIKGTDDRLTKFIDEKYENDKKSILSAIKDVKDSQEKSEAKLEQKLDRMANATDAKLDKVYETVNATNFVLAEIKGRLYPKPTEQFGPNGGG